jgi:two-component system, chemotaxis family, protein-glutamate methylesterase/glutaminase
MNDRDVRILVVDDSSTFRKMLIAVLERIPGAVVVGTAFNGKDALSLLSTSKPHLVTLDMEMPEMDGLETYRKIKLAHPHTAVIIVTSYSGDSTQRSLEALSLGALDLVVKPSKESIEENKKELERRLKSLIGIIAARENLRSSFKREYLGSDSVTGSPLSATRMAGEEKVDIVAIGISTGGPMALTAIVPKLPGFLGVPVLVVQHMPANFTEALAGTLDRASPLKVKEAHNGMVIEPNTVFIAPGGKQMKAVNYPGREGPLLEVNDDPPENFCRPSADYLFRSLAPIYGGRTLAVIMTGMGTDGAQGLKVLKSLGARVIAQDEATSVVFGMAREAISIGVVDWVLPLQDMADAIIRVVQQHRT